MQVFFKAMGCAPQRTGATLTATKCRSDGSQSARGMSSSIVTVCFTRAKSSTATSVSLEGIPSRLERLVRVPRLNIGSDKCTSI